MASLTVHQTKKLVSPFAKIINMVLIRNLGSLGGLRPYQTFPWDTRITWLIHYSQWEKEHQARNGSAMGHRAKGFSGEHTKVKEAFSGEL